MSIKHSMQRLTRTIQNADNAAAIAEPAGAGHAGDSVADLEQMPRELIGAYRDELNRYRRLVNTRDEPINPALPADEGTLRRIVECPPEEVRLFDLEWLERAEPQRFVQRWQEIKERALADLENGWWSGRSLEPMGGSAWRRACFLAVREALRQAWQPRNAGEALLIDEMAQYEMLRQDWIANAASLACHPRMRLHRHKADNDGHDRPITAVEANQEATRMVERLQRLYQNALRMLLNLRRAKPPRLIQSAHVNVAVGQQVNVGSTSSAADASLVSVDVIDDRQV